LIIFSFSSGVIFVFVGNSAVFECLSEGDIFNFCMKCDKTEEICAEVVTNCVYRGTKKNGNRKYT